jgi:NADH-quinone oxidoreductase subunit N
MAKFYMLSGAVQEGHSYWLVILGVLCAAVSAYYYFRVIQAMYFKEGENQGVEANTGFKLLLVLMAAAIVLLGIFPEWLINQLYSIL